jgi:hypothetical protein
MKTSFNIKVIRANLKKYFSRIKLFFFILSMMDIDIKLTTIRKIFFVQLFLFANGQIMDILNKNYIIKTFVEYKVFKTIKIPERE